MIVPVVSLFLSPFLYVFLFMLFFIFGESGILFIFGCFFNFLFVDLLFFNLLLILDLFILIFMFFLFSFHKFIKKLFLLYLPFCLFLTQRDQTYAFMGWILWFCDFSNLRTSCKEFFRYIVRLVSETQLRRFFRHWCRISEFWSFLRHLYLQVMIDNFTNEISHIVNNSLFQLVWVLIEAGIHDSRFVYNPAEKTLIILLNDRQKFKEKGETLMSRSEWTDFD